MNNSVKVALYAVLVFLAGISGYFALKSFGQLMDRGSERGADLEQIEPERKSAEIDAAAAATNSAGTNATNVAVATATTNTAVAADTNAAASAASARNKTENAAAELPTALSAGGIAGKAAHKGGTRIGLWAALFVISLIGLGLLIANDVSHYAGNRALKTLYNDEGEGLKNPEYEQAEQIWANGDYLQAISLMREYLNKNPREQHVAIRIAEIYEKDLKNFLAAALEYEEVLKHKLPDERWGWAAIHLCNLYFKLNQEPKAYDLLRRIAAEYPNTAAAEKARKRLGQAGDALAGTEPEPQVSDQPKKLGSPNSASAPPSGSALPPGFRPKK